LPLQDENERLVGCDTLQQARRHAGGVKRLCVRPETNGHGPGRQPVGLRIEAAREMGWKTQLVNAIKGNQEMTGIYEKIGFRYVDSYPECSDPVELTDYFTYMQYGMK
jgi:GNAT superfamily N-acetyltransferase